MMTLKRGLAHLITGIRLQITLFFMTPQARAAFIAELQERLLFEAMRRSTPLRPMTQHLPGLRYPVRITTTVTTTHEEEEDTPS